MSTNTLAPPAAPTGDASARMCQLLTRDQYFALDRMRGLLERRDALDAGRLTPPVDARWLVRALDAAIVSYYRLAYGLSVASDAERLLQSYRQLGLGTAA